MQKKMLKLANKKLNGQMIVAAAIFAIFAILLIISVLTEEKEAVSLDSLRDGISHDDYLALDEYDKLKGEYVSLDVKYVLKRYYTDKGKESVVGYAYLIYDEASGYMLSIFVSEMSADKYMEPLLYATYDYLEGRSDNPPQAVRMEGKFKKLKGYRLKRYEEAAKWGADTFFTHDYADVTLMYNIDTTSVMFGSGDFAWYMGFPMVGAVIWIIICEAMYRGKYPVRKIRRYIKENGINEYGLESDFANAKVFGEVYVGLKYTYALSICTWTMFSNDDLVWAYYYHNGGKNEDNGFYAYHYDKTLSRIVGIPKADAEKVLRYYDELLPQIVTDGGEEIKKEFWKDYEAFLSRRYNAAKRYGRN